MDAMFGEMLGAMSRRIVNVFAVASFFWGALSNARKVSLIAIMFCLFSRLLC